MLSVWLTGRVLFFIGYSPDNPMGRELGFDLTFFSSIFSVLFAVVVTLTSV
jgi:uncharacterized membrane protein YecN with MAPEG domain